MAGGLSTPARLLAKVTFHWRAWGSQVRRIIPWLWPDGGSDSSSSSTARPFHILRATEVPSNRIHLAESVRGLSSREFFTVHEPISKSKSCDPVLAGGGGSSAIRVSVATQLSSQVFPPSSENDCSKRHEVGVMSCHTFRTRIIRPPYSSQS